MATIKTTNVTAKVTRVYTLDSGKEVTVIRDDETGTVRCIYVRMNAAVDGISQETTRFNVQYAIPTSKVSTKTVNFGKSGDMELLDEIEQAVLDLAEWSVGETTEESEEITE